MQQRMTCSVLSFGSGENLAACGEMRCTATDLGRPFEHIASVGLVVTRLSVQRYSVTHVASTGIDERAKEFLKPASGPLACMPRVNLLLERYGPCYWGHNDMDYLHPWKELRQ